MEYELSHKTTTLHVLLAPYLRYTAFRKSISIPLKSGTCSVGGTRHRLAAWVKDEVCEWLQTIGKTLEGIGVDASEPGEFARALEHISNAVSRRISLVCGRHVLHGGLRRGQDARGLARRADEDGERRPFGRHRKTRLDGRKARLTCCRRSRYERTEGGRSTSIELAARTGRNIHKRISNSFRFLRRPCVRGASSQIERRARNGVGSPKSSHVASAAPRLDVDFFEQGPERQPVGARRNTRQSAVGRLP